MKRFCLLVLLVCPLLAAAQTPPNVAILKGSVTDSLTREPLIHAVVRVAGVRDTLYTVTDREGAFAVSGLACPQDCHITVSFLGYGTHRAQAAIRQLTTDLGQIRLAPRYEEIESVVVRERVPVMSMSGDTIQYNPIAVQVLEGSDAIELVRRLPGLEVADDGRVTILGRPIDRTLVDGRDLFGRDPRDALMNLPAADVVKVQVYDVRELGRRENKKVMNLVTRSKLDWNLTTNALASYGADTEKRMEGDRQKRYGAGAEINFFSDRNKLKTNFLFDNVGRRSNRPDQLLNTSAKSGYSRNRQISAEYENRSKRDYITRAGYRYSDNYATNERLLQQIYFPQEDREQRIYADTTRSRTTTGQHTGTFSIGKAWKRFRTGVGARFVYETDDDLKDSRTEISGDGQTPDQRANPLLRNGSESYEVAVEYTAHYSYASRRAETVLQAEAQWRNGDGNGIRADTLATTSQRTDLKTTESARKRNLELKLRHTEPIGRLVDADLEYSLDKRYDKSYRLAWDNYRNRIDTALTHDYTLDYLTQRGGVEVRYFHGFNLRAGLHYEYARQMRDERIALEGATDRHYGSWLPFASFEYRKNTFYLALSWKTETELPSSEMVRNQIDARNPLMLRAGNPALRQAVVHGIELQTELLSVKSAIAANFHVSARFVTDAIVARQQIMQRDSVLADYAGYRVAAGTILNSYANAGGCRNIETSFSVSMPVRWLGFKVRLAPKFTYSRMPEYAGSRLLYTDGSVVSTHLSLTSTFSKKVDLRVLATPAWGFVRNSIGDRSDYREWRIGAQAKWHFLKHCFLQAQYTFNNYHSYSNSISDQTDNLLNAALGVNFTKDNRCSLSVSVFDLLDKNRAFTSKMMSNYLVNTWRNVPGRYFTFNFSYRLHKSGRN